MEGLHSKLPHGRERERERARHSPSDVDLIDDLDGAEAPIPGEQHVVTH